MGACGPGVLGGESGVVIKKHWWQVLQDRLYGATVDLGTEHATYLASQAQVVPDANRERRRKEARDKLVAEGRQVDRAK